MNETRQRKKEKGNDLVNVLGLIIISVVILALFKGIIAPAFQKSMNKSAEQIDGLFEKLPDEG